MFKRIFVERKIEHTPYTQQLLSKLNRSYELIDNYADFWGRKKKPYLQKRDSLFLYIAEKKGQLVKKAPDAYGLSGEPHYYFVHAFNCIYECQYCYLQGHFQTPDLVLFVNHEMILSEMQTIMDQHPDVRVWFHAGEYSDALALSHLTQEWPLYWDFCQKNPRAYLELRTKSVNIKSIEKLEPLNNAITSFTLAPTLDAKTYDLKTPSLKARLQAIETLARLGHPIGLHFDPIILSDDSLDRYEELLTELKKVLPWNQLIYLSLGVVRFTKDVYKEVAHNYPESPLHAQSFITSFDHKIRYPRPLRLWLMNSIKQKAIEFGIEEQKIYLCMED